MARKNDKKMLEISTKDQNLLMLLFMIAILAAAYILGYQKLSAKASQYEMEYMTLNEQKNDLLEKKANLKEYKAETENYIKEYDALLSQYGTDNSQPASFEFMNKVERITNTWLKNVSFSGTSEVYSFGQLASNNPELKDALGYSTDNVGYVTTLNFAYEATYQQWKELINFINSYYSKNSIDTINMAYSSTSDMVSGSMTIKMYSIVGSETTVTKPQFDIPTGTDNIFFSNTFVTGTAEENGDHIIGDYDFYLIANPVKSSSNAIVMGARNDAESKAVVVSNSVESTVAEVEFTGAAGNYNVSYTLDGKKSSYDIKTTGELNFLVMSSARISPEDKNGVVLSVSNKTDTAVNLKVFNDDPVNKRIEIKNISENVKIH